MPYKINGTEVIKNTGQIDWARIKSAPTFLTGTTSGIAALGFGVTHVKFGLRLVGTTVQGTRTTTDCNCNCDCLCSA